MRKFDIRKGFIAVKDKKEKNWSKYFKKVWMLKMNIVSINEAGYLRGYTLEGDGEFWKGKTQFELIDDLKKLKEKYDLKTYSEINKEILVIYVDEILKVKGFLKDIITEESSNSVQVFENIEFREYGDWITEPDIKLMQEVVDNIFIPEKYFYFTPNQRTRKNIFKAYKKAGNNEMEELMPKYYGDFKFLRKALFGGICYCPYPGATIRKPVLHLDITSAYIYTLLTRKFPMKQTTEMEPENYEYYLNNEYETSLGIYNITYTTTSSIISCFKDMDGKNFSKGKDVKVKCLLNSVDLANLLNMPNVYINEINCTYLEAYELEYLPQYVVEALVYEYIKKSKIDKELYPNLYKLQKVTLNGIYGNTIKKANSEKEYNNLKTSTGLAPHWGIWTTSYTKEMLLGLAKKLNVWIYSDTDSIFCLDTEENLEIVKAYNKKIAHSVAKMCEANGLLFQDLQELGSFEIDHKVVKFKALKQKEYLYTEIIDGKEVIQIKAAGCNKEEINNLSDKEKDDLYTKTILPVGTRVFPNINEETTTAIIDGEKVTSNGSYWEKKASGMEATIEIFKNAF